MMVTKGAAKGSGQGRNHLPKVQKAFFNHSNKIAPTPHISTISQSFFTLPAFARKNPSAWSSPEEVWAAVYVKPRPAANWKKISSLQILYFMGCSSSVENRKCMGAVVRSKRFCVKCFLCGLNKCLTLIAQLSEFHHSC